jgi:hypothetical protein
MVFVRFIVWQFLVTTWIVGAIPGVVHAQRIGQRMDVMGTVGYAQFEQSGLKEYQHEVLEGMPVPGKIIRSFPGYLNVGLQAIFFDSTYYVGLRVGHTSTAGRIQYTDYTGSITADQLVKMDYTGFVVAKRVATTKYGSVFLGADVIAYLNRVELIYSEIVYDEYARNKNRLSSINLALAAFVQVHKRVGRFFYTASAGYEAHLPGDLSYSTLEYKFTTTAGDYLQVNANGIRANVGMGYTLYQRGPR